MNDPVPTEGDLAFVGTIIGRIEIAVIANFTGSQVQLVVATR